ncbi:MAG TPA: hypothetical protein VKX45_06860 [Bryobacteraceae bacterium]|jgi:hypothetical protein|nr:hypothetical protein [Bryobacteraceae bacterium]
MRIRLLALTSAAICRLLAVPAPAAAGITAANATVGRSLEADATVRLTPVSAEPVTLTLTSDDPARLLLSTAPDRPGSAQISLKIQARFPESPDFWLQGLADSGTVTYTVSAEGLGSAKGTVTLARSAVVILGPLKAPKFTITPHGLPARLTLVSVAIDGDGKVAKEQPVAGGSQIEVALSSSNRGVGNLRASTLTIAGGTSTAMTAFEPAGEGETVITPVEPRGFTAAAQYASVTAVVAKPGLAAVTDVYLGKNLQLGGAICLGEAAPPGGLEVTLTSSDPTRLIFSDRSDAPGSGTLHLHVPAGQLTANYFLQGLGDSGDVTYEATAPGFRSRTARVGLTPSGVIVAYDPYGPPDEATVLRKSEITDDRSFTASVADSRQHPVKLVVWTVHLDRETGRAADITVQPLRAGVTATVVLHSSDPAVGTVESPLTIAAGTDHAVSRFTPLSRGRTVISIDTPAGFTPAKNATKVPASVSE